MKIFYLLLFTGCFTTALTAQQTIDDCADGPALGLEEAFDEIVQDTPFVVGTTYSYCVEVIVDGFINLPIPVADITATSSTDMLPAIVRVTNVNNPGSTETLATSGDNYTIIYGTRLLIEVEAIMVGDLNLNFSPRVSVDGFESRDVSARIVAPDAAPVEWADLLTYRQVKDTRVFDWSVSSQYDVATYELQRQTNEDFVTVAAIAPTLTEGYQAYSLQDGVVTADAYYRVLQRDLDGAGSTSNTIFVPGYADERITAYPNPAGSSVRFQVPETMMSLSIHDITGRPIMSLTRAQLNAPVNTGDLATGSYTLVGLTETGNRVVSRLQVR